MDTYDEASGHRSIYEGFCVGGPLDEQRGQSRYPSGFVAVDKPNRRAWIYDRIVHPQPSPSERAPADHFQVREPDGRPLDDALRIAAAESTDWDVISVTS